MAVASPTVLAYRHVGVAIHTCGLLMALAFPAFLTISGAWRRLQQGLQRAVGERPLTRAALSGAAYASAWSLVSDVVQVALRVDRQAFGFEYQTWAAWLLERAEGTAALVILGLVVAAIVAAVALRSSRWWPLWSGTAVAGVLVCAVAAQPLFADLRPLPASPLKAGIERMLRRAGRPGAPVFLRRDSGPCVGGTNLGVFPTTRILIDDGYLADPPRQGVETAAHELGHYVRHDPELGVLVGLVWLSLGVVALYGLSRTVERRQTRMNDTVPDIASLIPAAVLSLTLVYVAGLPVFNLLQRRIEHRADAYAMALTHDGPAGVAGMLRDLRCDWLDPEPGWWARTFFWNHPSISERIHYMRRFQPSASGNPGA